MQYYAIKSRTIGKYFVYKAFLHENKTMIKRLIHIDFSKLFYISPLVLAINVCRKKTIERVRVDFLKWFAIVI